MLDEHHHHQRRRDDRQGDDQSADHPEYVFFPPRHPPHLMRDCTRTYHFSGQR
jgi:hypothetical protein